MTKNTKLAIVLIALFSAQTIRANYFLMDDADTDDMDSKKLITPVGGTPAAVVASCSASITRLKAGNGAPATWATIASGTSAWTDPSFTTTNYLFWAAPYSSGVGAAISPAPTYSRVSGTLGAVMYPPKVKGAPPVKFGNDILLGSTMVNSGFIAGVSAVANNTKTLTHVFRTKTLSAGGIIVAVVFVKGIPTVVAVDNFLPYNGASPYFAQLPTDKAVWGLFLEKIFAKVNVDYELITGASMLEVWDFLLGVPVVEYSMTGSTIGYVSGGGSAVSIPTAAANAWALIRDALHAGDLVGAKTGGSTISGLTVSENYNIVGAYTVTTTAVFNLFRIRFPAGSDAAYTGAWADTDSTHWTAAAKLQAPFVNDLTDGEFFITDSDFVQAFSKIDIGHFRPKNKNNYLEVTTDNGLQKNFAFTFAQDSVENFIYFSFYNTRMYPTSCRSGGWQTTTAFQLFNAVTGEQVAAPLTASDKFTSQQFLYFPTLKAGSYVLVSQGVQWDTNDVTDFTVRVYSSQLTMIVQQTPTQVTAFATLMLAGKFTNGMAGCILGTDNPIQYAAWEEDSCDLDNFANYDPNAVNTNAILIISGRLGNCHTSVTYTLTGLAAAPSPSTGVSACVASGADWVCTCSTLSSATAPCVYSFDYVMASGWSGSATATACA